MLYRSYLSTLVFLLLLLAGKGTAQPSSTNSRDQAIENISSVLFDSKNRINQNKIKAFENACGVKLEFRVNDASLDQLGGLSEHIFKLWQTFSTPINTKMNTITGEFSTMIDSSDTNLHYRTLATQDLRACKLPDIKTDQIDSSYNAVFGESLKDVQSHADCLDGFYGQAAFQYQNLIEMNKSCPDPTNFNPEEYQKHVSNTAATRAANWMADIEIIEGLLNTNFGKLEGSFLPGANTSGLFSAKDLQVTSGVYTGKYIINENNSVEPCTEHDMEKRCALLFAKTNIRYLFLTKTIPYYIPLDSINVFGDAATKKLFESGASKNIVVVLWIKTFDPQKANTGVFLVRQTGDFLTKGDIEFARINNGGAYSDATYYKFNNIYRNIPKPLILCYQVAKVNGLLTTSYFHKGEKVRGREQIYYHSFKLDKCFGELKRIRDEITQLLTTTGGMKEPVIGSGAVHFNASVYDKIDELRNRQKMLYINASANPELIECESHVKEFYLQDRELVHAAGLRYLKDNYGKVYPDNRIDEAMGTVNFPSDVWSGTCPSGGDSEVIEDVLNISSLLLSPAGLDFIPDALLVAYYAAEGKTLEAFVATANLLTPGSILTNKKILSNAPECFSELNAGSKLVAEAGQVVAVRPHVNNMAAMFRLPTNSIDADLARKLNDLEIRKQMLPVNLTEARIFSNAEKLESSKRIELIQKMADEPAFAKKVRDDPEEVLRWGGVSKGKFNKNSLSNTTAFSENISDLLKLAELTLDEFRVLAGKSVKDLSTAEKTKINTVRNALQKPTANSLLQKVIPQSDIKKYLEGTYKSCQGFMTLAADCKHLSTLEDVYYGMRLDYFGSKFSLADDCYGVIRFKASNAVNLQIPRSADNFNLGNEIGDFPFTGHGFTSANNGRMTVPEWKSAEMMDIQDGAELWMVDKNGVETLNGIYSSEQGRFFIAK